MAESLSPHQQAIFAQVKLKSIYTKTCTKLEPIKEGLKIFQEALLWRKPLISIFLYVSIHVLFWYLYYLSDNIVSLFARAMFWLLLIDGFWMIARRDRSIPENTGGPRWTRLSLIRQQRKQTSFMTFEEAVTTNNIPLEVGEVAKFEVVCLWISVSLMWLDNVQLATRHWNREQPYMLTVLLFVLGLTLCAVSYFLSGFWLLYLTVLFLLIWPIVVYYDLITAGHYFVVTKYPIFTEKIQRYYKIVKSHLHKLPEEEFSDIQLQPAAPVAVEEQQQQQQNPQSPPAKDPSISLPPFDTIQKDQSLSLSPFDGNYNMMDSLSSFTPNPQGFHYSPDDSLALSSLPHTNPRGIHHNENTRLSRIPEDDDSISMSDINPTVSDSHDQQQNGYHVHQELPTKSRTRTDTLTLTPFRDTHNPLHDSFDELESPDTTEETGYYDTTKETDFYDTTEEIGYYDTIEEIGYYPKTETNSKPENESSSYSSPYFSNKGFGLMSSGIMNSSTPLNSEENTLRNRQHSNNDI